MGMIFRRMLPEGVTFKSQDNEIKNHLHKVYLQLMENGSNYVRCT